MSNKEKGEILETTNCSLTNNFHEFLESEEFADVILKVGETVSIRAHRVILSARSPVFANMLKLEMKEKQSSEIVIEDISAQTLKILFKCLYSGRTDGIDLGYDEAFALYYAADKYEAFMVREYCAKVLVSFLTEENAFDVMALAVRHSDKPFKSKVIEYMYRNCRVEVNESQDDVKGTTTQHSEKVENFSSSRMFSSQNCSSGFGCIQNSQNCSSGFGSGLVQNCSSGFGSGFGHVKQ